MCFGHIRKRKLPIAILGLDSESRNPGLRNL